jgi:hypothetical protein
VQTICEHCSGGGERFGLECARNFAAALGRALDDGLAGLEVVRSKILGEVETMYITRVVEAWARPELLLKYENLTAGNVTREMMETAAAGELVVRSASTILSQR